MNKTLIFAKRNFKEIMRDPLSLIFNFAFPIIMLTLFFCFTWGKNEEIIINTTPMFAPNKIIPAVAIFGFSFLTMFVGMLVAKDRCTEFTDRLRSTPMRPLNFFLGYAIPMLVIALIQIIITYLIGWLFSLGFSASFRFNPFSLNTLASFFINIPVIIFFISCGIFFGTLINEKAIGGISSLLVNLAAITSGMFMPIYTMGWFKNLCQVFPFYHSLTLSQDTVNGLWPANVAFFDEIVAYYHDLGMSYNVNILDTWWAHLIIIALYAIIMCFLSIFTLRKKLQADNK